MKYWLIRVFEPSKEKGTVDKLLFAVSYIELEDLLDLVSQLKEKIILRNLKISITLKEVDFDV